MFLFETSTDWYDRFQELLESVSDMGDLILPSRDDDDE
jgi:hypothetical protein